MAKAAPAIKHHVIYSNINSYNCPEDEQHSACDCDSLAFNDELLNLDQRIDGRIFVFANLGLWNGRRDAFKLLDNNIKSILSFSDWNYGEWYGDGKDIKATLHHHDGSNYLEFRVIRENRDINSLINRSYGPKPFGDLTRSVINYYTKSLHPYIDNIYGWK